jgi:thioredoxin 1
MVKSYVGDRSELSEGTVILDFFAEWCGPCKTFAPVFHDASKKYTSATFIKVDVDENVFLSEKYTITSLPTVLILKNGCTVDRLEGLSPKKFLSMLESHIK